MFSPKELTERLKALLLHDPSLQLFGAGTHKYALNPCLAQSELIEFEQRVGVTIPHQYREFLLLFGNGGAGPGYGLLPLNSSIAQFGSDPLESITRPFTPSKSASTMVEDRAYPEDGLLPLAHQGCGHMSMLVVSGDQRGTIWSYQSGVDYTPYCRELPDYSHAKTPTERMQANDRLTDSLLLDDSRRLAFWDWYIEWLDRIMRQSPETSLQRKFGSRWLRRA